MGGGKCTEARLSDAGPVEYHRAGGFAVAQPPVTHTLAEARFPSLRTPSGGCKDTVVLPELPGSGEGWTPPSRLSPVGATNNRRPTEARGTGGGETPARQSLRSLGVRGYA